MNSLEEAVVVYNMTPSEYEERLSILNTNNMKRIVFVDLDETLIQALYHASGNKRVKISFEEEQNEWYGVIYREGSRELLAELRKRYDAVYMLTAAVFEYGVKMNDAFNFGFKKSEIYAREQWSQTTSFFIEMTDIYTKADTISVLIDNQYPDEPNAEGKMYNLSRFSDARYYRISEFNGSNSSMLTPERTEKILGEVDELLSSRPTSLPEQK